MILDLWVNRWHTIVCVCSVKLCTKSETVNKTIFYYKNMHKHVCGDQISTFTTSGTLDITTCTWICSTVIVKWCRYHSRLISAMTYTVLLAGWLADWHWWCNFAMLTYFISIQYLVRVAVYVKFCLETSVMHSSCELLINSNMVGSLVAWEDYILVKSDTAYMLVARKSSISY